MKYIINMDNPRETIARLQQTLMAIEVKGAGVEFMYASLSTIKQLYESIEGVPDDEEVENKEV